MHATVANRWLAGDAGVSTDSAAVRLFCFAHAGGGSTAYRPWRHALAPGIDVRSIVLPGREARVRELPYRRVEQLLHPLCEALEPYLDRPYAFFGHSLGSVLAYEVARRFSAGPQGGPGLLIVSGRRGPRLPTSRRGFSTLPDAEFLAGLGVLGGTPPEVLGEEQLLRLLLPTLRADFELNESYRTLPGPRLRCPVAAYMGTDDTEVDRPELLAWGEETTGEFGLRVFPGGHFYLKDEGNDVLGAVRQDLERALGCSILGGAASPAV
ncbi:alpha/beta fold hydrolase [Streptomyces parvus]|uniref:Alpha/beta fold hydrolase n=1 Tax=Streptomyces sp. JL1001 TaxID=3078227 RepID=A0AAU8K907_9ACTN|nr:MULTISPECIES: alpha/beta fold hydrolase [unclassified Streptomyces]PJN27243.1 thioesterase [Streptomyces sp. CB02613]SCE60103.1 medium-chain acyl-[acyl-carrier-protein] hydrolase [Streptomyces sp. Termitarium-T10T-6]